MLIRLLDAADWPRVATLEAAAYERLGLSESPDRLRSRAGAGTSFVLDADGAVVGYALSLPCPYGRVPDLGAPEPAPTCPADLHLHLHDMVVSPERRRTGLGSWLAGHLLTVAREQGYERVSLVALGGRHAFWTHQGFHRQTSVPIPAGYGPDAVYMSYQLRR
jgi:GNAT superfamily N-acetyltransferase